MVCDWRSNCFLFYFIFSIIVNHHELGLERSASALFKLCCSGLVVFFWFYYNLSLDDYLQFFILETDSILDSFKNLHFFYGSVQTADFRKMVQEILKEIEEKKQI